MLQPEVGNRTCYQGRTSDNVPDLRPGRSTMRLLLNTLLVACLGSSLAEAKDAATDMVRTETPVGQFYSAQLALSRAFRSQMLSRPPAA